MAAYDFIIVGAGLSGLSLACRLVDSPLRDSSILLLDRSVQARSARTWAFWARSRVPFDTLACRSWDRMLVAGDRNSQVLNLGPYRYKVIRGADFYRAAHEKLSAFPNVRMVRGRVEGIEDAGAGATVQVGGNGLLEGKWVFDSRFRPSGFRPQARGVHYLKMQFRGWEIETPGLSFDPATPTFLDFRTPASTGRVAKGAMSFYYMLPYSERRALVEYVACTRELLRCPQQEKALEAYIRDILGVDCYRVTAHEQGVNPMTDYRFPRRTGRHVMTIGVPGGMIKPTTGFAFTRIQHDSGRIVRSLLERGHPFDVPATRPVYRLYERLMLAAMARDGEGTGSLLTTLFKYGSAERILRFLDECGAPL